MGSWNGFEQPIGPLAVGSTINTRLPLEAVTSPSCMFQKRVRKTPLPLSRFEKQISAGIPKLKLEIPVASVGRKKLSHNERCLPRQKSRVERLKAKVEPLLK